MCLTSELGCRHRIELRLAALEAAAVPDGPTQMLGNTAHVTVPGSCYVEPRPQSSNRKWTTKCWYGVNGSSKVADGVGLEPTSSALTARHIDDYATRHQMFAPPVRELHPSSVS